MHEFIAQTNQRNEVPSMKALTRDGPPLDLSTVAARLPLRWLGSRALEQRPQESGFNLKALPVSTS